MTSHLSDTSTWMPLDERAPGSYDNGIDYAGFGYNKAEPSKALVGRTVVLVDHRGMRTMHRFGTDSVRWSCLPGPDDDSPASAGEDRYEAFGVAEGLVYVQFHHLDIPNEAVSLTLDFTNGRALSVLSVIGEAVPGRPRVQQAFVPARIDGIDTTVLEPGTSTALVGRRVLWEYSPEHAYEHIYLNPTWYAWQCLAGPEEGLADADECTAYELRPGIFLFAWREKVIPCAAVTVADHRDMRSLRAHGVLFGLDETGLLPTHYTYGAFGRLLSTTVHPTELDQAR